MMVSFLAVLKQPALSWHSTTGTCSMVEKLDNDLGKGSLRRKSEMVFSIA